MTHDDDLSDPRHPDHDLSEWSSLEDQPAPDKPWFLRRWFLLIVAVLVIAGMLLPYVVR